MPLRSVSRTAWTLSAIAFILSLAAGLGALLPSQSYWPFFWIWAAALALLAGYACANIINRNGGFCVVVQEIRSNRAEILYVLVLTALAFGIRTIALTAVPSPFGVDEPLHAYQSLQAIAEAPGFANMFAPDPFLGHPALASFLSAQVHRLFAPELAQRLISALWGTAFIPLLYLLIRAPWGKRIAIAGTAFGAAYHLHVHYSRIGINNIQSATLATLAVLCVWYALERKHPGWFLLAGLCSALPLYAYVGTRLAVLIVVGMGVHALITGRLQLKKQGSLIFLAGFAFFVAALPLLVRLPLHPGEMFLRSHLFLAQAEGMRVLTEVPARLLKSFGFFVYPIEEPWAFYRAPIPFVDWFSTIPFLLGLGLTVRTGWKLREWAMLLLFFVPIVVIGGLTTSPYSGRFLVAVPAICVWVALGADRIVRFLKLPRPLFAVFVLILCVANLWFYFAVYQQGNHYAEDFFTPLRLFDHVTTLPNTTLVFFHTAPRFFITNPEVLFRLRNYDFVDVYTNGSVVAIRNIHPRNPSPRTFLFFADLRRDELDALRRNCPEGTLFPFADKRGKTLAYAYTFFTNSTCMPSRPRASAKKPF
jgi:4-amino-4-deoxy-L-arabinose transferase-like glycosyltransferase